VSVEIVEVEHDVRHTFRIKVTGAPDMKVPYGTYVFAPTSVVFAYDGPGYAHVTVSGPRLLKDRKLGKETCSCAFYSLTDPDMPDWVREVCTQRLVNANLIARPDA
jgi:hypothetical protein